MKLTQEGTGTRKTHKVNYPSRHRRPLKIHGGDCNEIAAGKGDRPRSVDKDRFRSNHDEIDWSKGRKPDSVKPYRVRIIKESDRPEERRASTP